MTNIKPLIISVWLAGAAVSGAASLTWDASPAITGAQDGPGAWNTTAANTNWWDGANNVPWNNAGPNDAVFGAGSGAAGLVNPGTGITVGNLTFNAPGSGSYEIKPSSSATKLTLSGSPAITVADGVTATLTISMAGTGFSKEGNGTLVINGTSTGHVNTYAGLVIVDAGTMQMSKTSGTDGAITGDLTVNTNGTATLLAKNQMANTSTVTVNGGTLGMGTFADSIGGLVLTGGAVTGSGASLLSGTVSAFDVRSGTITAGLGGTVGLNKSTGDTVIVGGNNSYAGDTLIAEGTLEAGGSGALPSGTGKGNVIVTATLDLAGNTVSMNGLTGTGLVTNSVAGPAGLTVGNGNASSAFTGIISDGAGVVSLTKAGNGVFTLSTPQPFTGAVGLNGGVINFAALNNLGAGDALNFDGGTLQYSGNSADVSVRTVTINDGGATIDTDTNSVIFANPVGNGGSGGLTKAGSGTLILAATNEYGGTTTVSAGTLALGNAGSLANSPVLNVTANGILDASGRGDATLTLAGGQTLTGTGVVLGQVVAAAGSTLVPGPSGTLTISNTLTLQDGSATIMELNEAAGMNDQVRGLTSVNYGGTLTVTNIGGAQAGGEIYKLFDAGSYSGTFASVILPPLANGLAWTNSLAVDGTIAVIGGVISPVGPVLSGATQLGDGNLQFSITGVNGQGYTVWATTNVALTPVTNTWTAVSGGTFGAGPVVFQDLQATNFPARFYLITTP